jgi:hypothetical protein
MKKKCYLCHGSVAYLVSKRDGDSAQRNEMMTNLMFFFSHWYSNSENSSSGCETSIITDSFLFMISCTLPSGYTNKQR